MLQFKIFIPRDYKIIFIFDSNFINMDYFNWCFSFFANVKFFVGVDKVQN